MRLQLPTRRRAAALVGAVLLVGFGGPTAAGARTFAADGAASAHQALPPGVRVIAAPEVTAPPLYQLSAYGAIWVISETEVAGNPSDYTEITKIDSRTNRVVARLNLGYDPVAAGSSLPNGAIAAGARAIWVVDYNRNQLIKINPATDRVTVRVGTGVSPVGVAVAFGSIWVSHQHTSAVWRFDLRSLRVTARIPAGDTGHLDSTLGPLSVGDGSVWVVEQFEGVIQRINPADDHVHSVTVPTALTCGVLDFVPDGFWIDDSPCEPAVYHYSLARRAITATITAPNYCLSPVSYGDGALWAAFATDLDPDNGDCLGDEIGKYDPATGRLEALRSSPGDGSITAVPGGSLWFGDVNFSPPFTVHEYRVATF